MDGYGWTEKNANTNTNADTICVMRVVTVSYSETNLKRSMWFTATQRVTRILTANGEQNTTSVLLIIRDGILIVVTYKWTRSSDEYWGCSSWMIQIQIFDRVLGVVLSELEYDRVLFELYWYVYLIAFFDPIDMRIRFKFKDELYTIFFFDSTERSIFFIDFDGTKQYT